MQRRIMVVVLVVMILVAIPTTVFATSQRFLSIRPSLSFSGNTAQCTVIISNDSMSDSISAEIKLCRGTTCITTWNVSATGVLAFNDSIAVSTKGNYTLTVNAIVNGVSKPETSCSATYK